MYKVNDNRQALIFVITSGTPKPLFADFTKNRIFQLIVSIGRDERI